MAKLLFLIIIAAVTCRLGKTAVLNTEYCTYPGYPEIKFQVGEKIAAPDSCAIVTCTGKDSILGLTCPAEATLDKNCYFTEIDNSKKYPDCCPKLKCGTKK